VNRPIMLEQIECSCCRSSWKWLFLFMSAVSCVGRTPLHTWWPPVQGDHHEQEADILELSLDEFEPLLNSFD
jgi:hypothetical protein